MEKRNHFLTNDLSSDRPINKISEDKLKRKTFAISLADVLCKWKGKDSLIVALYGQWGCGKTSIKNMVVDKLKESEETCPYIIEFNPWQWSGQETIAKEFFKQISFSIQKNKNNDIFHDLGKKFSYYNDILGFGTSIINQSAYLIIRLYLILLMAFSVGSIFSKYAKYSLIFLSSIGFLLTFFKKTCFEFSKLFQSIYDYHNKTTLEIKADISEQLRKIDRPIVVIIDDIDRLNSDEIRLLFQLIKINADFPNMIYVLLFQKDIVEKAFDELQEGKEFLNKIIQIGFDVPQIEKYILDKVFLKSINDLFGKQQINKERWDEIYLNGISGFIHSLRDVYRYLPMLEFQIEIHKNDFNNYDINLIDFAALESIRIFEPKVYNKIYYYSDGLTEKYRFENDEQKSTRIENMLNDIINQSSETNKIYVKNIITNLFPTLLEEEEKEEWTIDLRICVNKIFLRYFILSIPYGDITYKDIISIFNATSNRRELVGEFKRLKANGTIETMIERLPLYMERLQDKHIIPFLSAIFDIGDFTFNDPETSLVFTTEEKLLYLAKQILIQRTTLEQRKNIIEKAIQESTGLYLPTRIIYEEFYGSNQKHQERCILKQDDKIFYIEFCKNKLLNQPLSNVYNQRFKLGFILWRCKDWLKQEDFDGIVKNVFQSNLGLFSFINVFIYSTVYTGPSKKRTKVNLKLDEMSSFISIEEISKHLLNLSNDNTLTQSQKDTINIFFEEIKKQKEN